MGALEWLEISVMDAAMCIPGTPFSTEAYSPSYRSVGY